MAKKNDWVATMLFNQPSSMEEVIANGVTPDNTGIKSKDYYRNIDAIQETFTGTDGKFNEVAFDNFYNSSLEMYNQFAQEEWTKKLVEDMDRDPFDWTNPLNTNVKDISATVKNGYNPERRSMSIAGIGTIGDPTFSIREIAQDNEVRDEVGNKLGWTPNQKGILSIFEPTVALATWDEDGTHLVNGIEIPHKKGDFKTDENGDFFYETLGKRESYDKEILRVTDVLTTDGSSLNKFDFFDSDGLTKSVGSVIAKTAMQITPLLIPGVGQTYGTISALTTLASVLPTLGKAINGIVGDNNSEFGQGLTQLENWFGQFKPTTSDKGKQSFFSLENIGEILTSSAKQLYQQKSLANLAKLVNKNDALRASNLGQIISLGYLALTSSQETYSDFRRAGASEEMAGIGMLASVAALYGLMNTEYFRDALFKGTFMDESEALDIIKNYNDDVISKIHKIGAVPSTDEALSIYDQFRKGLSDRLVKFLDSPFSGKTQNMVSKEGIRKAWNTGLKVVNRSVNEGVEETMEEVVFDAVKAVSAGLNALGIPVTEEGKNLDFGFTLEDTLLRWASAFVGGALGGAVFEGINTWEKFIGPKVVELADKTALEQMEYFIITGRTNELLDRAEVLYNKGRLGNKHLSATKTQKNSKGETIYAEGDENDNQNLASYNAIVNQIKYVDAILKKHNIHLMMDSFGEIPTPNKNFIKASEDQSQKQKELGINSEEYTYKFKTNALIEVFNKHKFGSSYVNDVVKLGDEIVKVESKLNKLNAKIKEGEDSQKTEEIKYWEGQLKDLLTQRDDLINNINTDKYIHEVLFMTSPTLRASFMADNVVEQSNPDLDEITKGAYWTNTIEGYVKTFYHKNFYELPEYEQKWYKDEFDTYKKRKGDEQLRLAARLHYGFIEKLNPNLIAIEETSKDKTLDNYHNHGMLNTTGDSDFSQFELLRDSLGIAKLGLVETNNAFTEFVNTWDPEKGDILNNEQYKQFEAELLRQEEEIRDLEYALKRYSALYGENAETQESITEEGKANVYDSFVDNVLSIEDNEKLLKDFEQIIALEQDIENLSYNIVDVAEAAEFSTPEEIDAMIESNTNTEKQIATKQAIIEGLTRSLSEYTPDGIRSDIVKSFADILNGVTSYYKHLKEKGLVSENHFVLKRGLNIVSSRVSEQLKKQRLHLDPVGEVEDDTFYRNLDKKLSHGISDYFNLLKVGSISEAVASYNVLISDVDTLFKEIGTEEDAETYVKAMITKHAFNLDIASFINNINNIITELETFSILDFLNNTEINIGEHVLQTTALLEEQEKSFIKSTDLDRYIINDSVKLDALKQIPRILLLGTSLFQNAYSGINNVLNTYREAAGKELLIDSISESTKDIATSHINYLWQKATTLLSIHKANLERKSEFHKISEVKLKSDFVRNLLFKKDEDNSFIKQLQTKFFGDDPEAFNIVSAIEDLMRKHHISEDTAVTDFKTYNTFFIELCNLLYDSVHSEFEGQNIDLEIGTRLAEILPSDAYKLLTGKITDDSKYKLTEWSTICFLATVMTERMTDMYNELYTVGKSYPNIVPIVGQEWNIMLGTAVTMHSETFNKILEGVANQDTGIAVTGVNDYLKDRVKLENFIFIQGGSGSGKTSVVAKFIADIIKKRNPEAEIITAGPEATQATNISNSLQSTTSYTFTDLMDKIFPGWEKFGRYKTSTNHTNLLDEDSEPIVITTKADTLFTSTSETKVLVLDEATFLSEKQFQILNKWASENNIKIIALGDRKQNGRLEQRDGKYIYSGIEDCLYISGPELTESLRNNNVAKANNLRDLTITINKVLDKMRNDLSMTSSDVEKELNKVVKLDTILCYYDDPDTFVGERFISKDQMNEYVDKFIRLSTELRKDLEKEEDKKPSVLLITEDVEKHALIASKGVTILTPAQAQGGEYDYVIIDKDFTKNPTKWKAIVDFYTAISRSRQGSVIVGNETFSNEMLIKTQEEKSKSIVGEPLSIMDNAESLRKWKLDILSNILSIEDAVPEEEEKEEKKTEEKKKDNVSDDSDDSSDDDDNDDEEEDDEDDEDEGDSDEDDEEEDDDENGEKDGDNNGSTPPPEVQPAPDPKPEPIEATFDGGSKPAILTKPTDRVAKDKKLIEAAVSKTGKKVKKAINKATLGKQIVDRINFLERISKEKDGSYEKQQEFDFVRLFSSAVMFNLDIKERHVKKILNTVNPTDDSILSESKIRHIVSQWNTQKRTFEAEYTSEENSSVIYYTYQYDGETEKIPVAYVNDVINGTLTVDKYKSPFKQVTIPIRIESESQISFDRAIDYGTVYSSSRIFAPVNNVSPNPGADISAKKRNEFFRDGDKKKNKGNSGKTFTLWSECDLFTDEDFEEMFKYKVSDDGKFEEYLNGTALEDGFGNYVYQTTNGISQAMLINIHRSCTLSELYDMVCIARYACGRIQYTDLTAMQQERLGKIHDRTRAIKYMKGILGNFGYNLLDETDAEVKKSQLATSLKDLKYKYRLLTAGYQSKVLGELFVAFEELGKTNPSWKQGFVENVFLTLQHIPVSNRSRTKTYQNCLEITNSEGKKYLAKYRQDGFYDIYEYRNYTVGKKVGEVASKGSNLMFAEIANIVESKLTSREQVINAIRNKELSLLIVKESYDINSDKYYYDLADDYDYIYSLINDIPGLDLSLLDDQLAKSQQFAFGFYINDIGREYQIGEKRGTNDSQQTAWRVNDAETSIPYVSKMAKIEASRFEIVGDFKEEELESEVGGDSYVDPRESFEIISIISEVEKKLLSLSIDGRIDIDPTEIESIIEKWKNSGLEESGVIINIMQELSEKSGIETIWDFDSNEPIFGKDYSNDPIAKSIIETGMDPKTTKISEYALPGQSAKRWLLISEDDKIVILCKKDIGSENTEMLNISDLYEIWKRTIEPATFTETKLTDISNGEFTWEGYVEGITDDDDYDAMIRLLKRLKTKEKLINC